MGIKISEKFLNDLTTKLIKAADGGQKLGVTDPEEVGQYVCSVLALGCELIPVIGSSLSALTTLFGYSFIQMQLRRSGRSYESASRHSLKPRSQKVS